MAFNSTTELLSMHMSILFSFGGSHDGSKLKLVWKIVVLKKVISPLDIARSLPDNINTNSSLDLIFFFVAQAEI